MLTGFFIVNGSYDPFDDPKRAAAEVITCTWHDRDNRVFAVHYQEKNILVTAGDGVESLSDDDAMRAMASALCSTNDILQIESPEVMYMEQVL